MKTRLIASLSAGSSPASVRGSGSSHRLSPADAARLHAAFVVDLGERLRNGAFELEVAWALEPGEPLPAEPGENSRRATDEPDMLASLTGVPWVRQEGADLGDRLYRALAAAGAGGGTVAAVGSDHPTLPVERVEEAFVRIEAGSDVAIGPATDGGYYLIALAPRAVTPRLFAEIAWSTDQVLTATLERCRELGFSVDVLAAAADVDTPADLERLALELADQDRGCPRTRRLLAAWGLLPTPAEELRGVMLSGLP